MSELLAQMRKSGNPLVLTINGRAQVVVQDAESYQHLLDRVEELEVAPGRQRALADIDSGHVTPLKKFDREFRRKHGLPGRAHHNGESGR